MKDNLINVLLMVILGTIFVCGAVVVASVIVGFISTMLLSSVFAFAGVVGFAGLAGVAPEHAVLAVIIAIAAFITVRILGKKLGPKHISESEQLEACEWDVPGLAWNRALSDGENLKALRKGFERHNKVVLHAYAWAYFYEKAKDNYSKETPIAATSGVQS